jgi:hypothetical protein
MIDTHLISMALLATGISVAAAVVIALAIIAIAAIFHRRAAAASGLNAPAGHTARTSSLSEAALSGAAPFDPALPAPRLPEPALR